MPVLPWVSRVVSATCWFAVNLAIVTALFLFSANLAGQADEDARNGALIVRALASFWLYIAAWTWFVRGVLQRPAKPADKRKPTGAEVLKSSLGCLANLVPIPVVFVFVGRLADWAWAGIRGEDAGHPARQAADRLLAGAVYAFDHADEWGPWVPLVIGGFVVFNVIKGLIGMRRRASQHRDQAGTAVRSANEATLQKLRKKKPQGTSRPTASKGGREILAPAGAASAATVGAAHQGAHGPDMSRFTPASGAREDRVLGALTYSSSDGAWWARREEGTFTVHLEGTAEGPDPHALDLARQTIQRSFEVLLRASEAARVVAQKRGVGLPRFIIKAVRVGAGSAPDVAVHLHCDANPTHDYVVRSDDKLHTFVTQ